jgi:hypothetical protein
MSDLPEIGATSSVFRSDYLNELNAPGRSQIEFLAPVCKKMHIFYKKVLRPSGRSALSVSPSRDRRFVIEPGRRQGRFSVRKNFGNILRECLTTLFRVALVEGFPFGEKCSLKFTLCDRFDPKSN